MASVSRALRLLKLFDASPSLRVTDASRHLGVGRSTAHRLLATLRAEGFLVQDPETRAYQLGPAMLRLGLAAVDALDLRRVGHDLLKRLSLQVEETVSLVVLEDDQIRFVDAIDSPRRVRVYSRTGDMMPAHCAATGKAILAELPSNELRALYPRDKLATATPKTIASRSKLMRDLAEVRRRGYAINQGESERDVIAVGAAVHDTQGRAIAGLGVAAVLTSSLTRKRVAEFAVEARRATAELEAQIAHFPTRPKAPTPALDSGRDTAT